MSVIHHSHLKSETSKSVTFDTETVKVTVSKMSSNRNTQKRRTDSGGTVSVQSDTLSVSKPLKRRKSRTKMTNPDKLARLWTRVDQQLKYPSLRSMIKVDPELQYWYCELCRTAGIGPCGKKYVIAADLAVKD